MKQKTIVRRPSESVSVTFVFENNRNVEVGIVLAQSSQVLDMGPCTYSIRIYTYRGSSVVVVHSRYVPTGLFPLTNPK